MNAYQTNRPKIDLLVYSSERSAPIFDLQCARGVNDSSAFDPTFTAVRG
jgi:hypothetical protein